MEECLVYTDENLPVEAFQRFREICGLNRLSDVTVKVHNVKFPLHRIILAATVPHFYTMFISDMVESRQNEVTINGIDPRSLDDILEFAYTGSIRITTDNVCRVLSASSYLQLLNVRNACCEFLQKRFRADNILGVRALAKQLGCSKLEKAANQFIDENFVQIAESKEYRSLKFTDLRNIISREELHANTSEEEVFNAVMNWVKIDQGSRKKVLSDLLQNIRVLQMSPKFINHRVVKEPLIRTSLECLKLLQEVLENHSKPESHRPKTRINSLNDDVHCIFALSRTPLGDWNFEKYDSKNDYWMEEVPFSNSSFGFAVTAVQNKLYVIGGTTYSLVNVLDLKTRAWSTVAPMKHARCWGCATVLHNKIYLCGGCIGASDPANTVQCYDPESDKWKEINPMKEGRVFSCAVALHDCLYVLGGGKYGWQSVLTSSVEKYDPQSGKWSLSTPMLNKRCEFGATALNGRIYVAGGFTGATISRSVEEYNPNTKDWKHIQSMNVARQDFSLVSARGKLYAVGGNNEEGGLNSVEVYDPDNGKWSFVAHMKTIKGNVMAAPFYRYVV